MLVRRWVDPVRGGLAFEPRDPRRRSNPCHERGRLGDFAYSTFWSADFAVAARGTSLAIAFVHAGLSVSRHYR